MNEQHGWVIERYINSVLHYWCGRAPNDFRVANSEAIRFARAEDANTVLAWLCDGKGRTAEHVWTTQ